jgi:ankyrin repeat protein
MILLGANVNHLSEETDTFPLLCAAQNCDLACVELLLFHGADVALQTKKTGWSALHAAAKRGDILITTALFKRGANPEVQTVDGKTAAVIAATEENADCVTLLRLVSLSMAEKDGGAGDDLSFASILEEFSKGLLEKRKTQILEK